MRIVRETRNVTRRNTNVNSVLYYTLHTETIHHPITGLNLLMTRTDLLDEVTVTPVVSRRSETEVPEQGILCVKEVMCKYDMWYGVVCKTVISSCMSTGFSLEEGRDTVSYLDINFSTDVSKCVPTSARLMYLSVYDSSAVSPHST